jgi:hypothetical protein
MKWLFRPLLLLLVALALAVYAAWLLYRTPSGDMRTEPKDVPSGDQEIAFLYQATNGSTWERFVTAVSAAAKRLRNKDFPDLTVDDANAFPQQTYVVPEVSLRVRPGAGRLLFRWYKLTSTQKTGDWVEALLKRSPPPLAVIGGNTSDAANELATSLRDAPKKLDAAKKLPEAKRPLLLLTTATADRVEQPAGRVLALPSIYAGRTFRFCFTNPQMAATVTDFIWSQGDLRPDSEPVYYVYWEDDAYSKDLKLSFTEAIQQPALSSGALAVARDWCWLYGSMASGGFPLNLATLRGSQFRFGNLTPEPNLISSLGTFDRPSPEDERAAGWLIQELGQQVGQQRPLLVLAGQSQPSRRFLRALEHSAPVEARRFVVATGDTLAFNTIYRDRGVAWPIQDLPFSLVFFCHRNPVDADAGFRPADDVATQGKGGGPSGTEDLLLFRDIVEAITLAAYQDGDLTTDAARLEAAFRAVRLNDDTPTAQPLFDAEGNRRTGTGEHVVYLRPVIEGERVLPKAVLTIWSRQEKQRNGWQLRRELPVQYDRPYGEGGPSHGGD